jgi:hypothetical protein
LLLFSSNLLLLQIGHSSAELEALRCLSKWICDLC